MGSDEKKADSVFDILYSDTRRLSSLLSQFSDDGLITEMVRASEETTSTQIGLSVRVVKADGTEVGRRSTTTKIDPKWLLPLLFLDAAQDTIQRDIEGAAIGSLVVATGRLILTDLSMLKGLWQSETAKRYVLQKMASADPQEGNRHDRRAANASKREKEVTDAELALEILPLLPHTSQVNVVTTDHTVWATIEPENMFGSVADLVLKHGSKVAGSWSILGILDARPFAVQEDVDPQDADYDDILSYHDRVRIGMTLDNFWKVATELASPAREMLGRPISAYGVTPLVIFREIETGVSKVAADSEPRDTNP